MNRTIRILAILLALCNYNCTMNSAGGTTDTGNAKIALIVRTSNGNRASHSTVTACPLTYHSVITSDSSVLRSAKVVYLTTNDTGYCALDTLIQGIWSIEINDRIGSAMHLVAIIDTFSNKHLRIDATLDHYSILDGSVGEVYDTAIKRFLVIDGLERRVPVGIDGHFTANDLPAGTFRCSILSPQKGWDSLSIDSINLQPGTVYSIDTTTVAPIDTSLITFTTTAAGAAVDENVHDVPLLIRLSSENFDFDADSLDLSDLYIVKPDGVSLPLQAEQWDVLNKQALLWVLVDTVLGNSTSQKLYLLRCNDPKFPKKNTAIPFDTAYGFTATYHFNGTVKNASVNRFNGIDSGSADTASGIIGRARAFDGKSQFIRIDSLPNRTSGAVSCWIRPKKRINSSMGTTLGIWGKRIDDSHNYSMNFIGTDFYAGSEDNSCLPGDLIGKLESADTGLYLSSTASNFTEGTWYYAVLTWNPQGNSLFINGTLEASGAIAVALTGTAPEYIGRNSYDSKNIANGPTLYLNGTLDEFRIESACRSASWVKLSYMNQRSDDKVVTVIKTRQ